MKMVRLKWNMSFIPAHQWGRGRQVSLWGTGKPDLYELLSQKWKKEDHEIKMTTSQASYGKHFRHVKQFLVKFFFFCLQTATLQIYCYILLLKRKGNKDNSSDFITWKRNSRVSSTYNLKNSQLSAHPKGKRSLTLSYKIFL